MTKFLEGYRAHLNEDTEKKELGEERERGRNTRVTFTLTRHEKPGKTPQGMSADEILPEGLENARKKGVYEKAEFLLVMGSRGPDTKPVMRARQTGQAHMEGVTTQKLVEILNREIDPRKRKEYDKFGIYAMHDLDPVPDVAKVLVPILAEGKKLVAAGQLTNDTLESWAINKYVNTPDEVFRQQGITTPRETAQNVAHRILSGVKMTGRLYENLSVKVNNFTHGPNPDALLKFAIVRDGKIGLDSLDEIGGAIKPGESVDLIIERDEKGELKPIKIQLRGLEYDLDMNEFKKLVKEYDARIGATKRADQEKKRARLK